MKWTRGRGGLWISFNRYNGKKPHYLKKGNKVDIPFGKIKQISKDCNRKWLIRCIYFDRVGDPFNCCIMQFVYVTGET